MNYLSVAVKILTNLSREFDVPVPDLIQEAPDPKLGGWYSFDTIHICSDMLKSPHYTLSIARHEFAHYLQDLNGLKERIEFHARKFEKNRLALGILPKTQTTLVEG